MTTLASLWLPILLSAVFVFVVSSLIHMVLQLHKNDYVKLAQEEQVLSTLRDFGVGAGQYMFPCASSSKEWKSLEMQHKFQRGPVGTLIVRAPNSLNIGKALLQWFVFSIVVSVFVAYLTSHVLAPGAHYLQVFRIAGTAAVLGYASSSVMDSIWKGVSWLTTLRFVIDGVVYGLVTAGTFGWLWPASS